MEIRNAPPAPKESGEPPVERIGRYEILSTVGSGGMSTVYRARLVGPAQAAKEVALKVIHPHLSQDREFVLMFLDEMRLAMALAHRNIVQTFDAGEASGTYFLVMELVSGLSLRELLDIIGTTERMPLDLVLFVAAEMAAALDYAHNFQVGGKPIGVVHRDVSPGNILLSSQGDVKLTDFGVAKAAGRLAVSSANLIMGKLCYMAPEQARGKPDPRSDIFALGAVIYEMLCGEPIRVAEDLHDVLRSARPDPQRLAQAPGVSLSLRELTMSCLDPRPQRRPSSAGELHHRLSDEIFRLPRNARMAADAHARLQSYMALALQQNPQQTQAKEKTAALARILQELSLPAGPAPAQPSRRPQPVESDVERPPTPAARADRGQVQAKARGDTALAGTVFQSANATEEEPLLAPAPARHGRRDRRAGLAGVVALVRRSLLRSGSVTARVGSWRRFLPWGGVALGLLFGVLLTATIMRRGATPPRPAPRPDAGGRLGTLTRARPIAPVESSPGAGTGRVTPVRPRHHGSSPSRSPSQRSSPRVTRPPVVTRAPAERGQKVLVTSDPKGAEVFDGSRRLGRTPLTVSSARARTLGVYAAGHEPREVSVPAGSQSDISLKLKRSVLAGEATSLRQLKALRDSGQISEFSYKRRRAELIAQKLVELKVKLRTGEISEEQYRRLVDSVKAGNE